MGSMVHAERVEPTNDDPGTWHLRVAIERVLIGNGVGEPGASLHGWRCEYPDRYGHCGCFAELVGELVETVRAVERIHAS